MMSSEFFKAILNLFFYMLIGYMGLLLIVFLFQRSLLYFPANQKPSDRQLHSQGLRFWPSTHEYRGFTGLVSETEPQGTVVIFHGNAGAAHHRGYYQQALSRQGLNVVLAEYPGYGGREGKLNEKSFVEDGLNTVQRVYQQFGSPVYLWGESLGAGVVASLVAATDTPIDGVVLFTPWDSLSSVAQYHYWYLPAKWLVKDKFDSVQNLQAYKGNVAIILAELDEVIPAHHGKKLYAEISSRKKLWMMENAGHNSVPLEPNLEWWGEVVEFLRSPPTLD